MKTQISESKNEYGQIESSCLAISLLRITKPFHIVKKVKVETQESKNENAVSESKHEKGQSQSSSLTVGFLNITKPCQDDDD